MGFLDFLFPKTCVGCNRFGSYLCAICQRRIIYLENQRCSECARSALGAFTHPGCLKTFGLDGLISLTYLGFPINKLVHKLKYSFTTDLAGELVEKIEVSKTSFNYPEDAFLIPVPLHWQRKNYRGFNQSEVLGKLYAAKLGLNFSADFLSRIENTRPQVGLSRQGRRENVKEAFLVKGVTTGKNFVVFDDVWTTGSTIKNVTKVLKRSGAKKVWGFTLARSG